MKEIGRMTKPMVMVNTLMKTYYLSFFIYFFSVPVMKDNGIMTHKKVKESKLGQMELNTLDSM